MRSSIRTVAVAPLAVAAVIVLTGHAGAGKRTYDDGLIVPDSTVAGAATLEDGRTWTRRGPTWEIRLTKIDDDLRLQYMKKVTRLEVDPFRSRPDLPSGYITFLLEVINHGEEGPIAFNPLKCWLMSNLAEVRTPLQMTDVSFKYRVAGGSMPTAYERFAPALFDNVRTVPEKGSINGLLIYETLEKPRTKSYVVSVDLGLPNGEEVRFAAPYRTLDKKERKAAAAEEGPPSP